MGATYDVIVVGLGGMGSAAAYHVARRGHRVLGLEAWQPGHAHGSSHGRTRNIREAYSESPQYMPLIQRAYALWRDLEQTAGQPLLRVTGGIAIGPADAPAIQGVVESGKQYGIDIELLSAAETRARFPAFQPPDDMVAVYQRQSGFLVPEACTRAHALLASQHGAELHYGEPVRRWTTSSAGVRVETDAGAYAADRLIVTAGPWTSAILAELGLPLTVTRMYNVFFEPRALERFQPSVMPIYGWELPEGEYYGVPALPGQGLKIGRHDVGEACTPETTRREVTPGEIEALRRVLDRVMPGAAGAVRSTLTCLYTMTPDHHFILDRHPTTERVVYACGFSGHGFKFACVVGEIMADLALTGSTPLPIDFLAASRFAGEPVVSR